MKTVALSQMKAFGVHKILHRLLCSKQLGVLVSTLLNQKMTNGMPSGLIDKVHTNCAIWDRAFKF